MIYIEGINMNISFDNVHKFGNILFETQLFKHYHFPDMLNYYSENFVAFKQMPSIHEFESTSSYLREFHKKNGQNHLMFILPENKSLNHEFQKYLNLNEYDYSYNELYFIQPEDFPKFTKNPDIVVENVKSETMDTFLQLQFNIDLKFGVDFAKGKQAIYKTNFNNKNWKEVIAYYKGIPAGTLDLIISDTTVEIDNFVVLEHFQRRGIGTHMQKYVMEQFPNHVVILVAEGGGTAREMYIKQNYKCVGYQYEILKIMDDF